VTNYRNKLATRLNSFRSHRGVTIPIEMAIQKVSAVPGIDAIELNYPQHFPNDEPGSVIFEARRVGLDVTALNLRFDGQGFAEGAFTHPDEHRRREGIRVARNAVELAAGYGIGHVILWMGQDGFDYPFQAEYARLWEWEIEGFRAVASADPNILVSVEYKAADPRRTSLIRSMSDSLLAVSDVGLPNFGVTLDFCHALMAGEEPAMAAAQALSRGKLFGLHLNDGYGPADDGLMIGSIHLPQTLELLWELRRWEFDGTIYFDTFPERIDPSGEAEANANAIRRLESVLDRIDPEEMQHAQQQQDGLAVTRIVHRALTGAGVERAI